MPTLRLAQPIFHLSSCSLGHLRQLRWVHDTSLRALRRADHPTLQASTKPEKPRKELSLLEELFPEEIKKSANGDAGEKSRNDNPPRLPLSDFDDEHAQAQAQRKLMTRAASVDAFRQSNMTVLLLTRASKSLVEGDFRRIAPKGKHIKEWRGPGDILEVIPGRDSETLESQENYFLVFPNPAYARAYQNHVVHLHRLAQTHTPSSIESPLPPPPGMLIEGEDVHSMLQDYTICPPSQRISLRVLYRPYAHNVKRILQNRGYPQIVLPENKTGRAVLFWVNGYQLNMIAIKSFLAKDGQDRGVQWGALTGKGSIEVVESPTMEDDDVVEPDSAEDSELKPKKRKFLRWIIAFENEAEARRFTRTWHRRPFPLPNEGESYGNPPPVVHADFMW